MAEQDQSLPHNGGDRFKLFLQIEDSVIRAGRTDIGWNVDLVNAESGQAHGIEGVSDVNLATLVAAALDGGENAAIYAVADLLLTSSGCPPECRPIP